MGRYFAVEQGDLYIFTTGNDVMLSLGSFPANLGLFEADAAWRVSPRVAVVEDVLQRQLDSAIIVLRLHGYEKASLPRSVLESYFVNGGDAIVVERMLDGRIPSPAVPADSGYES